MSFCSNCGAELGNDSKFCSSCGKPNKNYYKTDNKFDNSNERRYEYFGNVKKCPSCGEDIPSFTAICPACGHELNSAKVSKSLEKFIEQVNICEASIANRQEEKKGWSSWSKTKKVWWIILNIIFAWVPLVIYLVYPLMMVKSTPKLSKEEKKLVSLIENFPFPNDRESLLSALNYIKDKIDFLSKETITRKSSYWIRLWCSKAEQLKQKAELMFPNDVVVKSNYTEILLDKSLVDRKLKLKAIFGGVIFVASVAFILIKSGAIDTTDYNAEFKWPDYGLFVYLPEPETNKGKIVRESEKQIQVDLYKIKPTEYENYVTRCKDRGFTVDISKTDSMFYADNEEGYNLYISYDDIKKVLSISLDAYNLNSSNTTETESSEESEKKVNIGFDEGTYDDLTIEKYVFSVPHYWDEEGSKEEYYQAYAEKEGKTAMFSIGYPIDEEDEVNLQALLDDNDNMIKSIESTFGDCEVIDNQRFCSDYGVDGMLYSFTFREGTLFNKYDGNGKYFCFPSPEDNRWYFVILTQTENTEKDYTDDFMKILASIRKVEE